MTSLSGTERFWSNVDRSGECWQWVGVLTGSGYGHISVGKQSFDAHRYSWMLHNGPIPTGLFVLHHCDNRPCVNPEHLFLGTHADNMRDRKDKGRAAFGDRNGSRLYPERRRRGRDSHLSRLTEEQVIAIRARHAAGEQTAVLAREFGVYRNAIYCIVKRISWKHV